MKIKAHTSLIGNTGYNSHSRNFFTHLDKLIPIKVRNFTIGENWDGQSHDKEPYLTEQHKNMLVEQSLWEGEVLKDFPIYSYDENFIPDVNIVLVEANHYYMYHQYNGYKIAYVVWESTRFPDDQFENLLSFDQLWVPSNWQKECAIEQGYPSEKVKVVPEGVHQDIFYPEKIDLLDDYNDGRFKFLLFGRWDYRKSTTEIIETFLKTFDKDEPVDLIASIDNPFSVDGMDSTEERLKHYGFEDGRIKIKSFVSREDYIKYMKIGHVFLSCARSEGWNLPLIEAMACGIPSIYSDWGGQLEFAKGLGYPVKVIEERPYNIGEGKTFNDGSDKYDGNYCEPDYNDLSKVMRDVYENYKDYRINSLIESEVIRRNFNWENAAEKGYDILKEIESDNNFFDIKGRPSEKSFLMNEIYNENIYGRYVGIEKDDIVVDIGAHIGLFSRYAIDRGAKKCFAIEPCAESYDYLLENIKTEKYINKINTLNKAIYHSDKSVFIASRHEGGTIGAVISLYKTDNMVTHNVVGGITFKNYIESLNVEKIDYLKVDCEGGEYDIFTDENLDYIENNVKKIAGEFHQSDKPNMNEAIKIFKKLEDKGFDIWVESSDGMDIKEQLLNNYRLMGKNKFASDYYYCVNFWALNKKFNININVDFVDGPKVTIHGRDVDYKVDFIDGDTNNLLYSNTIKSGHWTKCYTKYYVNWIIRVSVDDEVVYEYKLDLTNKKVHIHFYSKALGDTLAWIPYVEEFRKKHNCEVICTTFWNQLFKEQYPGIEFIEPGSKFTISSGIPSYEIGWFYDEVENPNDVRTIPLQQTASDILGLDYKEIRPKIDISNKVRVIHEKYVCMAIQATTQIKYWNCKGGWQKTVDYLKEKGYKVVCIDMHKTFGNGECWNTIPSGVIDNTSCSIEEAINLLSYADFHIGMSSGLSWLSWGVGTPVLLVSSWSKSFAEFQSNCIRVHADDSDWSGSFNDIKVRLDSGNWNWNPYKECKTMEDWYDFEPITFDQVINGLDRIIKGEY